MQKNVLCLIAVTLFILGGVAQAQVSITYSAYGKQYFSMAIPDNWQVNVGSEENPAGTPKGERLKSRLITAMPQDGTPLWFGMWVPADVEDFKEAKEYIDSLGLGLLTDVVTTERKFETLNGMDVYYAGGTGKKEDENMDFYAAFVQLSKKTVAIAIYIGPHETTVSHGDELTRMFQSLLSVEQ